MSIDEVRDSLGRVSTVIRDPKPAEFEVFLDERRRLGHDRRDEERDGVYCVNPAPTYEHQRISQQLAELLGPLARASGLEATVGGDGEYADLERSRLIDLSALELAGRLEWPHVQP